MGSIGGNLCNSAMCIQLASNPAFFCIMYPRFLYFQKILHTYSNVLLRIMFIHPSRD